MPGSNREHTWLGKHIKLVPSETVLKFRKDMSVVRVGANFKFCHAPTKAFQPKLVLKHLSANPMWKVILEPSHSEVSFHLKKSAPLSKFLNIQVGIGHNFHEFTWKWNLTTSKQSGGDGISWLRKKTSFELYPGMDLQFWWKAGYGSSDYTRFLETFKNMRLEAKLEKVEAIVKIDTFQEARKKDKTKTVKKGPLAAMLACMKWEAYGSLLG